MNKKILFLTPVALTLLLASGAFAQNAEESSYESFYTGGNAPGLNASTHEPLVAMQNVNQAQELAPQGSSFRGATLPQPFNADYSLESYSLEDPMGNGEMEGYSHSLRLAYGQGSADGKQSYGLRGGLNYMIWSYTAEVFDVAANKNVTQESDDSTALNFNVGPYYDRYVWEQGNLRLRAGASADYLRYGASIADQIDVDNAFTLALHGVLESHWSTGALANLGLRLQRNMAGDYSNTSLGLSALYNHPVLKSLDVQGTVLGNYLLSAEYPTTSMTSDPVNDYYLVLGAGATWYMSSSFGLNIQYRTALLMDDYSSHTLQLGSRMAF